MARLPDAGPVAVEGRAALQTATTVFGRAATLKASGAAALLFIVFLLIVGLIGASGAGQASADSCGRRGSPGAELGDLGDDSAQTPGAQTRKNQKENALIIDSVAQTKGLSGRATLIALMTALQESTLLNLPYGHLDSIGLFQQRPSMGWGSRKQIMQPRYAASMFFYGAEDGDPQGSPTFRDGKPKASGRSSSKSSARTSQPLSCIWGRKAPPGRLPSTRESIWTAPAKGIPPKSIRRKEIKAPGQQR